MREIAKKHSKIGIASCAIGVTMFLFFLIATVAFSFQLKEKRGAGSDEAWLVQLLVEMLFPVPVHLIGLALGAAALFFPNRKKLFPVLGVLLNLVFGVASLFPWLWLIVASLGRVQ